MAAKLSMLSLNKVLLTRNVHGFPQVGQTTLDSFLRTSWTCTDHSPLQLLLKLKPQSEEGLVKQVAYIKIAMTLGHY